MHASSVELQQVFYIQFQAKDSIWSRHCGLVCFSPDLLLTNTTISDCGRIITAIISHKHQTFDPLTVSVLYAPANRRRRYIFLSDILRHPSDVLSISPVRQILLGNFNYSYATHLSISRPRQAPSSWLQYINQFFHDGITAVGNPSEATFHRVLVHYFHSAYMVWSSSVVNASPLNLFSSFASSPRLASSKVFYTKLATEITRRIASFPTSTSAQDKHQPNQLSSAERILQGKRHSLNGSIRNYPDNAAQLLPQLSVIEAQLAILQQYQVETLALRSGIRWRELGEISAGYLKRTVAQRQSHQMITTLTHHVTNVMCDNPATMLDAVHSFYSELYSQEPIDDVAVNDLLNALSASLQLSSIDHQILSDPIDWDDIFEGVRRSLRKSSPGKNGIPYEILRLIFAHPACQPIPLQVYNDGLSSGIFPQSWYGTSVSLLPKKGGLSVLRNWRPISLINTNAKVFTRILNCRIISCADSLVNPFQTGSIRRRFIADNDHFMKLVMEHAPYLNTYSQASNAKVNFHKTEALSLPGSPTVYNQTWRPPLLRYRILA
ncbi:hypothetical protein AB4K20DRAFT_2008234 [Rhizopus microsporus]